MLSVRPLLACIIFICLSASAEAFQITAFSPGSIPDEASIDSVVGLEGFEIEDFEDTTLVSGFSYLDPVSGVLQTSLPALVSSSSASWTTSDPWDGDHMLSNFAGNVITLFNTDIGTITLLFDGDVQSVAFGISNFQFTTAVWEINGVSQGLLSDVVNLQPGLGHNGFLRIDVEAGDAPLNSISLTGGFGDGVTIDHVAFSVPEPASGALIGLALLGFGIRGRIAERTQSTAPQK